MSCNPVEVVRPSRKRRRAPAGIRLYGRSGIFGHNHPVILLPDILEINVDQFQGTVDLGLIEVPDQRDNLRNRRSIPGGQRPDRDWPLVTRTHTRLMLWWHLARWRID